jgi:uncharacterized protein (TIGR02996 family)
MNDEQTLLEALHADPGDEAAWLALADCLEESGQADRAELLRLHRALRGSGEGPQRERSEQRLQQLLLAGVRPCVPALTSSIGMELALIPAGTFLMGSPAHEEGCQENEGSRHLVQISRAFYLGVFPVTQAQWRAVMGDNPCWFCAAGHGKEAVQGMDTSDFPVEFVSWEDVTAFLEKLSALEQERSVERIYRLPTEAEWEYACRAGTRSAYAFGHTLDPSQANFASALARTSRVGSYRANAWGLHDLHGNLHEWCSDWYDRHYYASSPRRDPPGPSQGSDRVNRGGCWFNTHRACRSASRSGSRPDGRGYDVGFRVVMVPACW